MKTWSKDQLIRKLQNEGLVFSEFSLVHEGNYDIDDADWNYKDVPHLHYIHDLVEAIYAVMTDKLITTINVQTILGLKFPMSVVNYESGKNEQTYFTTWFFFTLIVQSRYEKIAENKTRVITTYHVGSPKLLKCCFPIIRFLLKRNYNNLMNGDIPMRERRGTLRAWGYTFYRDTDTYSFPKTMEILKNNIRVPVGQKLDICLYLNQILPQDGTYFHGRDDHLGLRLIRKANMLFLFPRICMHEGASLDKAICSEEMKLKCPWHGRLNPPIAQLDLSHKKAQKIKTERYQIELCDTKLVVKEINLLSLPSIGVLN